MDQRGTQMEPIRIQGGSKMDQRWIQAGSKKGPRRTQRDPRLIKDGAKMFKDESK